MIPAPSLLLLAQIVFIDLSFSGENAVVVGMAVAALPAPLRRRAMAAGIAGAAALRFLMAFFAVRLLRITGLLVAGGILLLWVGWKMTRELRAAHSRKTQDPDLAANKFLDAVKQIIAVDVSMSLDNVLGVAGVARDHKPELAIGLVLSVALMGLASTQIARLTTRYPKIAILGIGVVLYTALRMIYDGAEELLHPIHAFV
ncbi:MAG: YjbE family putative metal transport protein [Alphaproteobacteria bacterium]|nr:YjbE family putative metal transport protein [Alphaproteobacteria bacterium]